MKPPILEEQRESGGEIHHVTKEERRMCRVYDSFQYVTQVDAVKIVFFFFAFQPIFRLFCIFRECKTTDDSVEMHKTRF